MNEKVKIAGALTGVAALGALGFEGIKFGVKKGKNFIKEHKAKKSEKEEVKVEEEK